MNIELELVKELYELTQNTSASPPPKAKFLSWKCPKCGGKLKKKSLKYPISTEVGGTEFAHDVVKDFGALPGFYSLNIEHFTCECGYEFANRKLEKVEFE